jgi:chromosome segregation ATPase
MSTSAVDGVGDSNTEAEHDTRAAGTAEKERLAQVQREFDEFRTTSAEIERELQAALEDKESETERLRATVVDLESRAKRAQLEVNDARAECDDLRDKVRIAEEKSQDQTARCRAAEAESERAERLLRQRDFEVSKLSGEISAAEERALLADTTAADLKTRTRELEQQLIHVTEERDAAVIARHARVSQQSQLRQAVDAVRRAALVVAETRLQNEMRG